MPVRRSRSSALVLLPTLLLPMGLVAASAVGGETPEEPEAAVADEITVTAQKVEESLLDVPISIVTRTGEELEAQAIGDMQALAQAAPGVVASSQTPTTGEVSLTIRGVGSSVLGLGTEPTVGYYVDGVYMPRPQAATNPFLDVERVEVLRGPQGTLWGRNSTAGAINVVTRPPRGEFHGRLFGSFLEYDASEPAEGQRYGLSLTGPVTSKVWGRLSASSATVEDATYNEFLGARGDNLDGASWRGGLSFLPSDSLTFTIRADGTDDDAHSNFYFKPGDVSAYSTLGTINRFLGYTNPADIHRIATETAPLSSYRDSGYSLHIDKVTGGGLSLSSISSWRDFDSMRDADIDGSPVTFATTSGGFESEWWSQEFQLHGANDRASWVAGAYGFGERSLSDVNTLNDPAMLGVWVFALSPRTFLFDPATYCSLGVLAPPSLCGIDYYRAVAPLLGLPLPGMTVPLPFRTDLDTSLLAAYGQADWHLSDRLTLTTGARYTADDKEHRQQTIDFETFQPAVQTLSDSWTALTPRLGLTFRPRDGLMLYGSAAAGFKSGGYNSISLQPAFDEETVTSLEVGFKSSLADRRIRVSAAAFHYDYDDLQVSVLYPDRAQVENAAKARIQGIDFEFAARPNPRFSFDLSFELLDDEFTDYESIDPVGLATFIERLLAAALIDPLSLLTGGGNGAFPIEASDLSGNSLPRAADFSASAALQYSFDLGTVGDLLARAEYQYTDDVTFDPFGHFVQPAYRLLHAQVRWSAPSGRLFVAAYGRNLGDEEFKLFEYFTNYTGSLRVWAPPMEVGVQLGFDF